MASKGEDDGHHEPADPIGAVSNTNRSEPLATKADDVYVEQHGGTTENIIRPSNLEQTKSYATSASGFSALTTSLAEPQKKKWYKKLNPLRWSHAPPVPTEREVSKEYGASYFSLLVFQWMAPLMTVSLSWSSNVKLY